MKPEKAIDIPPDIAESCDAPDQGVAFDTVFRRVLSVPKAEVERRERADQNDHRKRGRPKGEGDRLKLRR
jgi:hypothetical protein